MRVVQAASLPPERGQLFKSGLESEMEMNPMERFTTVGAFRYVAVLVAGLGAMLGLTGCLVAGVSSNGGAFLWPGGGIGLLLIILLLFFVLRRR